MICGSKSLHPIIKKKARGILGKELEVEINGTQDKINIGINRQRPYMESQVGMEIITKRKLISAKKYLKSIRI